ncbi:AmmeMemoRadiSam system protein B [Myxococcota bacterium]|nr:AmmeMemoRadiSam system protein B [Myxococcota bacterium]MBU1535728.1 AmmeMemoRadiSam system protein B [Myxococcota bacterium]
MQRLLILILALNLSCKEKQHSPREEAPPTAKAPAIAPRHVRPAVFAQQGWYSRKHKQLMHQLDTFLKVPTLARGCDPMAIVVPHAGYRYSGRVAGQAYSTMGRKKPHRVIVLGLSHRVGSRAISVADYTHLETPLGALPVDREAAHFLMKSAPDLFTFSSQIHEVEHSAEMQLPFVRRLFGEVPTLVVLVGNIPEADYKRAGALLAALVNEKTLLIASSDFTHRGPRYRYSPLAGSPDIKGDLRKLDMGAYEQIALMDRRGLRAYKRKTGITMCGINPVSLLLETLLHARGSFKVQVAGYETSGDITGDWTNTVSYVGAAFCRQDKDDYFGLDKLQQKTLHRLAGRVLRHVTTPDFQRSDFDPAQFKKGLELGGLLSEPKAPFVTLKKNGRLRGCIGYLRPQGALWEAVASNAYSAALRDRRFKPVTAAELPALHVEISVLSLPRAVASPNEIIIGRHGMIMTMGNQRATFLPQVATEQKWDRDQTLRRLAQKAGIPPQSYPRATFEVYTAQVF